MKKSGALVGFVLAIFLVLPVVSAVVTFDPVMPLYNVGDEFNVKMSVSKASDTYDFLTVKMRCSTHSVEIYRTPLQVGAGEKKNINFPIKLDRFLIGDLRGACYIEGTYGGDIGQSTSFEISSDAVVTGNIQESIVNPGSLLKVSGNAIKKNGKPMEGTVDISVPDLAIKSTIPVKAGEFNLSIAVISETKAGTYTVLMEAREFDSAGYPINEGSTSASFQVPQIPTTIDIAIDSAKVLPGSALGYTALVNDQTGLPINVDAEVSFNSPNGELYFKKKIISGHLQNMSIESNATPGLWTVKATYGALEQSKFVAVEELENASFVLQNRTLLIINTGNVPYTKDVEVLIGSDKQIVSELVIEVGESEKYILSAPEGSYPIVVSEGNSTMPLGNVFLTGRVVGLKDSDDISIEVSPWLWWIILIIFAMAIAIYAYQRVMQRSYFGKVPRESMREPPAEQLTVTKVKPMKFDEESVGKIECAVVSLHVKNMAQLESVSDNPALDSVASIITRAKNMGAVVYNQGEHKVIILPSKKISNPSVNAISLAKDIENSLNDHNKRYALKISFGVGINKGMMIAEDHDGNTKFTSVGNTVISAKKIAEMAKNAVLLSEEMHRATIGKAKVDKFGDRVWKLSSIAQRGQHSEFIDRFSKRNNFKN